MPSTLDERFCLKNGRKTFSINFRENKEDRASYFGKIKLSEKLIDDIRQRYAIGAQPKKFLYGQYGVGKTHTLFNIKYEFEEKYPREENHEYTVKCCFIDAEFQEKTNYNYLHAQMMDAITLEVTRNTISNFLAQSAGPELENRLRSQFGDDANIARAIQALGYAGDQLLLWKWLCGGQLKQAELNSFKLTKNLDTVSELYKVLIGVVRLLSKKGERYLFLLDEMEGLQHINNKDCRESFHQAFRKLADDDNNVIGFIVSIYAMDEQEIPDFVFREDIKTRLNRANIHHLSYLSESDVKKFIKDLFELVIDENKRNQKEESNQVPNGLEYYPLTDEALDTFVNLAVSAPTSSIPRNLISALNEAAVWAANRDSYVIEPNDIEQVASIFSDVGI